MRSKEFKDEFKIDNHDINFLVRRHLSEHDYRTTIIKLWWQSVTHHLWELKPIFPIKLQ